MAVPSNSNLSPVPLHPRDKEREFRKRTMPASLHEDVFRVPGAFSEDEFVLIARSALQTGRVAGEKALTIANATFANPMLTEPARHRAARDAIHRVGNPALETLQSATDRINKKIAALTEYLKGPPAPGKADALAHFQLREVRDALRPMTREQRRKVIIEAIRDNDVAVITAVLRGSPFLSGLDANQQEEFRLQWAAKYEANATAQRAALQVAADATALGFKLLHDFSASQYDNALIERAEEFERRAAEASA